MNQTDTGTNSNDGESALLATAPYRLTFTIRGVADLLFHRWSNEDVARLHTLATPEMVSYFVRDLEQNKAENVVNKVAGTRLLQGDLAEAWREGDTDYASVAMRYSLVDTTLDRATGRVVKGDGQPEEVTEVWTFLRPRGGKWELSAIQQTS